MDCYSCSTCSLEEQTTLNGCYIDNDCFAGYWFPTACGCYGNEFISQGACEGCAPPSFVICGCDLTFLECYGYDIEGNKGTDMENRSTVTAIEGVHYKIDKITYTLDDHSGAFGDEEFNLKDFKSFFQNFVGMLNFEEVCTLNFYVEYTVLTELHSVNYSSDFHYSSYIDIPLAPAGFSLSAGNSEYPALKSKNIQPGKHIIHVATDLNVYALLTLDDIGTPVFSALAYEEGEQ